MIYKGRNITISNYKEIFRECTPDVLDEIRLAVLDNTDIVPYINQCGTDSYRLGQIRLALRENVDRKYVLAQLTPRTMNILRECNRQRLSLSPLNDYIIGGRVIVSVEMLELMVYALCSGADITKVDFTRVREDLCETVCQGLVRGYPMWLFLGDNMTVEYINVLLRGLDLGIDISPCIKQVFSPAQLLLIFSQKKHSSLLRNITPNFPYESISVLLSAMDEGLDISQLLYRDKDGFPIYSSLQMQALVKALELEKTGVVVTDVFNPSLSDKEMYDMLGITEDENFLIR
ncbi:MAG: hypothetical protein K2P14_03210 [Anaeroplasmataceae bacterium]|nr:hypothetical protein [Anaeroplasmataceae bacterium]